MNPVDLYNAQNHKVTEEYSTYIREVSERLRTIPLSETSRIEYTDRYINIVNSIPAIKPNSDVD